jgi:hypothetical protein
MCKEQIAIVVEAGANNSDKCRLTMDLTYPDEPRPGPRYVRGTLSVQKPEVQLSFPLWLETHALRQLLAQARRLASGDLNGNAVLLDYDYQPVLELSWVRVQPPILVISGEYTACLIPGGDLKNVGKYPYEAKDRVQYTALIVTVDEVGRLVHTLEWGLSQLGL